MSLTPFKQRQAGTGGGVSVQAIGGIAVGATGTGNNAGFKLVDGWNAALDIVSPTNPLGALFATHGGYGTAAGSIRGSSRLPDASVLLGTSVEASPDYTGYLDSNRGIPLTYDGLNATPPHSLATNAGTPVLRLMAGPMSVAEAAKVATGDANRINRAAMVHFLGRMQHHAPCIVEWCAAMPNTGAAGHHPTAWQLSAAPGQTLIGNEAGFESNSGIGANATMNVYQDDHNGGAPTNTGTLVNLGATYRDGGLHTFKIVMTTTTYSYYVDDVLVRTLSATAGSVGSPTARGDQPDFDLFTNHIFNGTFGSEAYSSGAWAALTNGVPIDLAWMRWWVPTAGTYSAPVGSTPGGAAAPAIISDILVTAGSSGSVVLPSAATIWGATPPAVEYLQAIQNETEEPGGLEQYVTTNGMYGPSWMTYNAGTRTLSWTNVPSNSGDLKLVLGAGAGATTEGNATRPARFRFCVAPIFTGSTTQNFVQGSSTTIDVYAMFDNGRAFQAGTNPKGLVVTGVPAGLAFSATTGKITGNATTAGPVSMTYASTNAFGQTTSATITGTVQAAATGNPIPALSSATTVHYFDATNPGVVTVDSTTGRATAVASVVSNSGGAYSSTGSISMATTSVGPSFATAPVYGTAADGNSKAQGALIGTGTEFLTAVTAVFSNQPVTLFAVFKPSSVTPSPATLIELCPNNSFTSFTTNRVWLGGSSTSGYQVRKCDASGNQSVASVGSAYTAGIHVIVGRAATGATAPIFNLDSAANIVGTATATAGPTSANKINAFADFETNAFAKFSQGALLCWGYVVGTLSDADQAALVASLKTSFGTP